MPKTPRPHADRYIRASMHIAADTKREKVKRGPAIYTGMMVATQAAIDHPEDAKASLDELKMPLGVREELVRNAAILAKGRTGTRPPGFSRKVKH